MKAHYWLGAVWLACACKNDGSASFGDLPPEVSMPGREEGSAGEGGSGGWVTSASGGTEPAVAGGPAGGAPTVGGTSSGSGSGSGFGSGGGQPLAEAGAAGARSEELGAAGAAGSPEQPPPPPEPTCGNGRIDPGEECDGGAPCKECQVVCSLVGQAAVESKTHHCYLRSDDKKSYDGAKASCEAQGGYMATIADKEENDVVRTALAGSSFIGASENVSLMSNAAGVYAWVTGEPFSFTNWARGEPNRDRGYCSNGGLGCFEHCLAMINAGTWEDHRCDLVDSYVCEWQPPGQGP